MMDPVLLARLQFAFTIGFHFLFPPLSIGLAWLVFYFMNRFRKRGEALDLTHARFWTKLLTITFGVGVATGITMEFQFGTNWAQYSRFVGDIFGAPLAAEAMLAFFLESTFIGVLIFGWDKLSQRTLWFASLMVALGSTLSAFWILVANSWMQTPAGYEIVGGRAQLTELWTAVFNPSSLIRFLHTTNACLMTGSLFMAGISAWYLRQGLHRAFAARSLQVSLVAGFAVALLQLPIGHHHAVQVAHTQPEKLAAFEGLFETQQGAPLLVFGWPDPQTRTVHGAVRIPKLLSLLTSADPDATVQGLSAFPREEWPPVRITFLSFHLMFLLGLGFIGLTGLGLLLLWQGKLYESRWFLLLTVLAGPLPLLANELGWMAAEVGRQPWIVYRVLKTQDAISVTVPAWQVLASLIGFVLVYAILGALWIFLIARQVRLGPQALKPQPVEVIR